MITHQIRLPLWMVLGEYMRRHSVGHMMRLKISLTHPLPSFFSAFTALGVTGLLGGGTNVNISRRQFHFSGS